MCLVLWVFLRCVWVGFDLLVVWLGGAVVYCCLFVRCVGVGCWCVLVWFWMGWFDLVIWLL